MLLNQKHVTVAQILSQLIRQHIDTHNIVGRSTDGQSGFIISYEPFVVVTPAIGFFTIPHYLEPIQEHYAPFPPELAIEVEDTSQVTALLNAGTRQVWVLYPHAQTIDVHDASGIHTLTADDLLDGGDILPDFSVPVQAVFGHQIEQKSA